MINIGKIFVITLLNIGILEEVISFTNIEGIIQYYN